MLRPIQAATVASALLSIPIAPLSSGAQIVESGRVEFKEMMFALPSGQWERSEESDLQVGFSRGDGRGWAQGISVWRVEYPPELNNVTRDQHTRNMWDYEKSKPRPFGDSWAFEEARRQIGDRQYDVMQYRFDEPPGSAGGGIFLAHFPDDFQQRRRFYMFMWFEIRPSDREAHQLEDFDTVVSSFRIREGPE